jgi:hypothetical protein
MALFFYGIGAIFYKIIDIHISVGRLIPSLNFLKDAESSNSSPYFVGIEIIIKMDRVNIIILPPRQLPLSNEFGPQVKQDCSNIFHHI